MFKLVIVLVIIYTVGKVGSLFISDYSKCYSDMEAEGVAAFGCCHGLSGGTRHTNYLQESCIDCPYLVLINKKG